MPGCSARTRAAMSLRPATRNAVLGGSRKRPRCRPRCIGTAGGSQLTVDERGPISLAELGRIHEGLAPRLYGGALAPETGTPLHRTREGGPTRWRWSAAEIERMIKEPLPDAEVTDFQDLARRWRPLCRDHGLVRIQGQEPRPAASDGLRRPAGPHGQRASRARPATRPLPKTPEQRELGPNPSQIRTRQAP